MSGNSVTSRLAKGIQIKARTSVNVSEQSPTSNTPPVEVKVAGALSRADAFAIIKRSGLFDANYYSMTYQLVNQFDVLLEDFLDSDTEMNRRPNPYFEPSWYLDAYPDVTGSKMPPLVHYILHGDAEGRWPGPLFDTRWYRARYGIRPEQLALAHYLQSSGKLGLRCDTELDGTVERISSRVVSGWVADLAHPSHPLTVELLMHGEVVCETVADRPRQDLAGLDLGETAFGFQLVLQDRIVTHTPAVRVKSSGLILPVLQSAPASEGVVEHISWPNVFGWGWRVGQNDAPADMDLFLADRLVQTVRAAEFRDHLAAAGIGDGKHGFAFDLEGLVDAKAFRPEDVSVAFHDSGTRLTVLPSAIQVVGDALTAELIYERGFIRGWVHNNVTNLPERIEISLNGEVIWAGQARRLENVALTEGPVRRLAGFRVQLPAPANWTQNQVIEVRAGSGEHVPGSPVIVPYGDQYLGSIDNVSRNRDKVTISGWCIDTTRPSSRVPLSVFYGGKLVLEGVTHKRRPDLSATGFDAPFAGFDLVLDDKAGDVISPFEIAVRPGRSLLPLSSTVTEIARDDFGPIVRKKTTRALTQENDEVEGTIDEVSDRFIAGWARNKTNPDVMVVLDCFIDGVLYATTSARKFRADLKKFFNDHGFHQYLFELTPALAFQNPGKIEIVPRTGKNLVKQKITSLRKTIAKSKIIEAKEADYLTRFRFSHAATPETAPRIAIIVINRDGEDLLSSFLTSFQATNTYERYEIIIVDHASTDGSEALCQQWQDRLKLRWLQRRGNFSFSDSNNFGVQHTDAELVIFANNDVTFTQDLLAVVGRYMDDKSVGCLGIRLGDDSPQPRDDSQVAIQHLGVHFTGSLGKHSIEAFESR